MGGENPKAFPLKEQYVSNIKNARSAPEAAAEPHEPVEDAPAAKRARVSMPAESDIPEPEEAAARPAKKKWDYNMVRKIFFAKLRSQKVNVKYSELVELWNASEERRKLLASLSVGELKKRKFLPKGASVNPWSGEPGQVA